MVSGDDDATNVIASHAQAAPEAVSRVRPTTGPGRHYLSTGLSLSYSTMAAVAAHTAVTLHLACCLSRHRWCLVVGLRVVMGRFAMTSDKARTERIQRVYESENLEELATEYNVWASEYETDLRALRFSGPRAGAETLANYVTDKEAKILDAGAGTGMVGKELARLGFKHITALDLSPGMLIEAKKKSVYEDLKVGDLGKPLEFETGRFAGTTCIGTLTFGHAPPESLDELVRVTKTGGTVVFSMRTDYYTEGGFDVKQRSLEEAGKWRLVQRGEPFPANAQRRTGYLVRNLGVRSTLAGCGRTAPKAAWSVR